MTLSALKLVGIMAAIIYTKESIKSEEEACLKAKEIIKYLQPFDGIGEYLYAEQKTKR